MKLLLISKSKELKQELEYHFSPLGFSIEYFQSPMEVINNLDLLVFDVVLFNANDFPRHWKPMVKLLREQRSKEKAVVILTNKEGFPFEEASKAIHLEINGLISENLSPRQLIFRLEEILRRYKSLPDNRKFARLLISHEDNINMLFTHPKKLVLIFGEILDISIQGMNFLPFDTSVTEDLLPGNTIEKCSLRIGEQIIRINCTITRNKNSLGIMFESFENNGHNQLFNYLMSKSERELSSQLKKSAQDFD